MEFFKWKSQFNVNIPEMDLQHRKFFLLLNQIHLYNEKNDRDPEFLDKLFGEIFAYVQNHFSEEEKLLEEAGFEELAIQKIQHQYFKEQLAQLREQQFYGDISIPKSVLIFMRDWFLKHILEVDKKYEKFLKNRQSSTINDNFH